MGYSDYANRTLQKTKTKLYCMSIDKRELMINNWVYWNKEPYQIDIDHLKFYLVFEPIPLSSELLSMIEGFKKEASFFDEDMDAFDIDCLCGLRIYVGKYQSAHFKPTKEDWFPKIRDIQYLHQLQNLYFCLSGNELKLTL